MKDSLGRPAECVRLFPRHLADLSVEVLMVSTLRSGPVRSLFHALREVYVPMFCSHSAATSGQEENLDPALVRRTPEHSTHRQVSGRRLSTFQNEL